MSTFNQQTTIAEIGAAYPGTISGRTYLVTGGTSGLGLTFSKYVAQEGAATVVITGRSEDKLDKTLEAIKAVASPNTTVKTLLMDQESPDSIRQAAERVTSGALGTPKIDVVINNAGVMAVEYKNIHGYERHFFCNHLSHFLFTNLIASHIVPGGRIINTSSWGHSLSPVRFDDIGFKDGEVYNKWLAYGQSKSANILFSKGLTKRFEAKGIESFAVHPGLIIDTGLGTHLDPLAEGFQKTDGSWSMPVSTPEQGVSTYLYAAVAPELNGKGGSYLFDSQIQDTAHLFNEEDADKLWELSNRAFGTSF